MAQKQKRPVFVSAKGKAIFPQFHTPDTKFDADGVYRTKLACDPNDPQVQKMVAQLDAAHIAAQKSAVEELVAKWEEKGSKGKKPSTVKEGVKPYTEDDEGNIVFSFKMKATVKPKQGKPFTQKPALFVAKGTPIKAALKVGGGSTLRVGYELSNYYTALAGAGVSLRLKSAQVIELVSWGAGARSAADYGFGVEEGFGVEDADENVFATADAEDTETAGDEEEAGSKTPVNGDASDF